MTETVKGAEDIRRMEGEWRSPVAIRLARLGFAGLAWQAARMSDLGVVLVVVAGCVVAFVAGVLVGRGPVRHRRDAEMREIVGRAVEASSEQIQQAAHQSSSPIAEKTVAIEAHLQYVREQVGAIQADAAGDRSSIKTQLHGVAETTRRLSQVLDKPASRGSWGEGLIEQVLQSAGMVEGVHYDAQRQLPHGGKPDFTIYLHNGLQLHLDSKVPRENFESYREAAGANERKQAKKAFVRDVNTMVKDLAQRNYAQAEDSVDIVVMCVPNESIYAFMHEADPDIIDTSLRLGVVLCSISTLFAVLGIVRQATKNFQLEARTDEVLSCLDDFHQEWARFVKQLSEADRQLGTFTKSWDGLKTTRSDKLDKTIERIRHIERSNPAPMTPQDISGDEPQAAIPASETAGAAAAD